VRAEFIEISDELFLEVAKMITERYGIRMPPEKKVMFQSRLQRRLHELNIHSFYDYVALLFSEANETEEIRVLADLISTNKTEFFREKEHFQFLETRLFPEYLKKGASNPKLLPQLKVWSAGCSNGQEAYSIGIQLEEFLLTNRACFDYSILATDISGRMLKVAKQAVYPMSHVADMPLELKHRYFLKSKNTIEPKVKVVDEIRKKVKVAYMNLMDGCYPFEMVFDVVFIRNTLIYFDPEVQLQVLKKVLDCLKIGGYLFIGHSESLINIQLPIQSVAPSVYVKTNTEGL
jgi:chemotaxis protein methyltransferase CheR